MTRIIVVAVLMLAFWAPVIAQQPVPHTPAEHGSADAGEHGGEHEALAPWKWANFAILAVVLGWMISKTAPGFFRSRTEEIQRGIAEASRMKQDAEARAAKVEMRMASLQSEIEHLRAEARAEMAKENARLRKETENHLARVQAHAEQEIAALTKHAEQSLRAHAAGLAVELAEQRIRSRMNPEAQDTLFQGFLRQLDRKPAAEVRR